jgi:protein TonB
MPSAPLLKVIEGGRAETGPAPLIPPAVESERLYPIFASGRDWFLPVMVASLMLHGAALLAAFDWEFPGEERVTGGSDEVVVVEGIDVILLDRMPSVAQPLAQAREISDSDVAEAMPAADVAAVVADRPAMDVSDDRVRPEADSATVAPLDAVPVVPDAFDPIAVVDADRSSTPTPADPVRPTLDVASVTADESAVVEASEVADVVPDDGAPIAIMPASDDPVTRSAEATAAPTALDSSAEPVTAAVAVTPSEAATARAVTDQAAIRPVDAARAVIATEILPEPPLPPENPLEIVRPKPEAKQQTAAVAPKTSAPAPAGSAPARGPGKAQSQAGSGSQSKQARGTANLSSYQSKLVAHLRRFRTYPEAARRQRIGGTASVQVTIDRSGRVTAASLARSSGHGVLDREAVAMARRASPFPAIPSGLGRSRITFQAPIRFNIR